MNSSRAWLLSLAALSALGAGVAVVDRYLVYSEVRRQLAERLAEVQTAWTMQSTPPELVAATKGHAQGQDLKALVQREISRHGIPVIYLNDSERELGKDVKERNVVTRALNVPHAKLVAFLGALEAQGAGAKVKELRLKPAKEQSGVYEEAESVLTYRWVVKGAPR